MRACIARIASALVLSMMVLCVQLFAATQGGDLFGWKLVDAGDFDCDGVRDMLITDKFGPIGDTPAPGRMWVISGATREPLLKLSGRQSGDAFGAGAVALCGRREAGETNSLAVSADGSAGGVGYVRVFTRKGRLVYEVEEPAAPGRSLVLANAGDLDADGHDNLVVGVPHFSDEAGANIGCVVTHTADGGELYRVRGVNAGAGLGYSITSLEDLDGDGVRDLVATSVSAAQLDAFGGSAKGYALVLSGKNGGILGELAPAEGGRWYGSAVAEVGDLDDDGFGDFAVGQPYDRVGSRVLFYSGKDRSLIRQVLAPKPGEHAHYSAFGSAVQGIGDVDGDEIPDVAIGCPASGFDAAFVSVVSGRTGAELWRIGAPSQVDGGFGLGFGTALSGGAKAGVLLVGAAEPRSWMDFPGAVHAIDVSRRKLLWRLSVAEL